MTHFGPTDFKKTVDNIADDVIRIDNELLMIFFHFHFP